MHCAYSHRVKLKSKPSPNITTFETRNISQIIARNKLKNVNINMKKKVTSTSWTIQLVRFNWGSLPVADKMP